jgi:hypothetical protein
MKITTPTEQIETNTQLRTTKFGVAEGTDIVPILIDFLSRLYPYPRQTIMNEYVSNARDSHESAGCPDKPIDISLPNKLSPYFIVRDYGVSMTDDQIQSIYSKALKSTKRGSDDQIGGYGVGKLVFSQYNMGTMILSTWIDGMQTVYQCRLKGGDGEIIEVFKGESDEPQGVEVKIEILEQDFKYFHDMAKYLYAFYKTPPNIKGVVDFEYNTEYHFKTDKFSLLKKHVDSDIRSGPIATIGDIPFSLYLNNCYDISYELRSVINSLPIVFHFDVGEISHTPSRDSIEYSPETINKLVERAQEFAEYIVEYAQNDIESATSVFDARCLFYECSRSKTPLYQIATACGFKPQVEFEGVKYTCKVELPTYTTNTRIRRYHMQKVYRGRLQCHSDNTLYVHRNIKLFIDNDEISDLKKKRRIRKYLMDNANIDEVHVINTPHSKEELCEKLQFPESVFENIMDLEEPVVQRNMGGYRKQRETRSGDVLYFCGGKGDTINVNYWEEADDFDISADEGIYIPISRYKPCDYYGRHIHLINCINELKALDPSFNLYGIKKAHIKKAEKNPNMISLEEYIRSVRDEILEQIGKDHHIVKSLNTYENFLYYDYDDLKNNIDKLDSDYYKSYAHRIERINKRFKSMDISSITQKVNTYNQLVSIVGGDVINVAKHNYPNMDKKNHLTGKMRSYVINKYPLSRSIHCISNDHHVEYINGVELYRKHNKKSLTQVLFS